MKKFLLIAIGSLIVISSGWFWWKFLYTYSEGNRSGLLQKFSHRGNIFKTYEGELVLNSLTINGTAPIGSEKFYFSVADEVIGEKMKNYEGQRVVLHYNQKNGALPWRGDTEYIVDTVKVISP
jgi:hypothetical protein